MAGICASGETKGKKERGREGGNKKEEGNSRREEGKEAGKKGWREQGREE